MNTERLSLLRRKQYLLLTMLGMLLFAFYFLALYLFPTISPQLFFGIVHLLFGCLIIFTGSALGPLYFFPSMRELEAYTLHKLGARSTERRTVSILMNFSLAFLFLYQAVILPTPSHSHRLYPNFFTMLIVAVFALFFLNLILYFENRRFDRSTSEQLAGHTWRSFLWGIVFTIVFFALFAGALALYLYFKLERTPL